VVGRLVTTVVACAAVVAIAGCGGGGHTPSIAALRTADLVGLGDAESPFENVNGADPRFGGDVNGDGIDDIVLGGVIVVLGRRSFPRRARVDRLDRTFHVDVTAHPVQPGCCDLPPPDELLEPVTALGDLDGDGYDELGIGGLGFDYEGSRAFGGGITPTATAYVLFGRRKPASVVLDRAGDRVASITTGLSSNESASVSLTKLRDGRLLAVADQNHDYANRCGRGGHPLPVLTRPLTSVLAPPRRGARIDLAAGGAGVQRLRVPRGHGVILDATPIGDGLGVRSERQNGRDCYLPPAFTRVGSPAAFAAGRAATSPSNDIASALSDGEPAVGDLDGDGNDDIVGSVPAAPQDIPGGRSYLTLRLGRSRTISASTPPPIAARLGPWPAEGGARVQTARPGSSSGRSSRLARCGPGGGCCAGRADRSGAERRDDLGEAPHGLRSVLV
jgi:hypothetical protein